MDRIRSSRVAYLVLAWSVVVAVLVQVSLVGLWLFSGQPTMAIHKEFGHAITLMVLALLVLAFAGRIPGPMKLTTAMLSVVMLVQTEVFYLLSGSPLRAFHSVLPLVIFALAIFLAYSAIPLVRERPKGSEFALPVAQSLTN